MKRLPMRILKQKSPNKENLIRAFNEKLSKEKEDEPVEALISLRVPSYDPIPRPDITFPDDGKNPTAQQLEELGRKEKELYESHFQPVFVSIVEKFKTKGHDVSNDKDGLFLVKMSFKDLKDIQSWDEIGGTAKLTSDLASARVASGISEVSKRGINGSGINVAQIEAGGR